MGLLDLFSKKKHIRIKHKKYEFELFDCPGRWMERNKLEELQQRMISIAVARLKTKPSFSFFTDINLLKNKLVTICSDGNTDCAFNAMTYIGNYKNRKVVHLGVACSTKEDKGLMQLTYLWICLYLMIHNNFRQIYISSMTHTPKIFGSIAESFSNVFPKAAHNESPMQFHLDVKNILMDTYLKEWDLPTTSVVGKNFTIKGFRIQKDGTILYPDTSETVPKHRKDKYSKYCLENINYEEGDEILQVGTMKATDFLKNLKIFKKGQ